MNNQYFEKESDYVRPADAVKRECLLPRHYYPSSPSSARGRGFIPYSGAEEDEQYKRALEESEIEFELEQALIESALEEGRKKAREDRARNFAGFKIKFSQFKQIDKDNQVFYATLINYIDSYESGDIIQARVGAEFYGKFLKMLSNIRLSQEDRKRIMSFIVLNE